jgi:hypothetical protein
MMRRKANQTLLPAPPTTTTPCRHLVVAKSMTRLVRLLLTPPPDPQAAVLAPQLAANAVAIAEAALQVRTDLRSSSGHSRGGCV